MSKFISIHQYAKKHGFKSQNVYRWIRERKIKEEDVRLAVIEVKRLQINEKAKPL